MLSVALRNVDGTGNSTGVCTSPRPVVDHQGVRSLRGSATLGSGAVLALCSIGFAVLSGCASRVPYNPDHLTAAQAAQVGEVCRKVLGLEPSAPEFQNQWPGDPDRALQTNSYRGCVTTLSDSLRQAAATRLAIQADQKCQSMGLKEGSSTLSLCVLASLQADAGADTVRADAVDPVAVQGAETNAGSASSTSARKERLACAAIGLDPTRSPFSNCVSGLEAVASAEAMESNYRN